MLRYYKFKVGNEKIDAAVNGETGDVIIFDENRANRTLRRDDRGHYFLYNSHTIYLKDASPYSMRAVRESIRENGIQSVSMEDLSKSILSEGIENIRFIYQIPVRYLDVKVKGVQLERIAGNRARIPTICSGVSVTDGIYTNTFYWFYFKPTKFKQASNTEPLSFQSNMLLELIANGDIDIVFTEEMRAVEIKLENYLKENIKASLGKRLISLATPFLDANKRNKPMHKADIYTHDT